jgi:prepilin-type N-terminal cleavage/methylation domain-containing protein
MTIEKMQNRPCWHILRSGNCRQLMNRNVQSKADYGFSLGELLLVVAIIAILASLFLPALTRTKERARRATCLGNERQFALAALIYANDYNHRLPVPGTDNYNPDDTHTAILSTISTTNLLRYASSLKSLDCPNLHAWMEQADWRNHLTYGVAIGYHYLGGHRGTPWDGGMQTTFRWVSPQTANEDPATKLIADLNVFCYSFTRVLSPHTGHGPVVHDNTYYRSYKGLMNETPGSIGGRGGNIALLDGSASWRPIKMMRPYKASQLWDTSGAYGYW